MLFAGHAESLICIHTYLHAGVCVQLCVYVRVCFLSGVVYVVWLVVRAEPGWHIQGRKCSRFKYYGYGQIFCARSLLSLCTAHLTLDHMYQEALLRFFSLSLSLSLSIYLSIYIYIYTSIYIHLSIYIYT